MVGSGTGTKAIRMFAQAATAALLVFAAGPAGSAMAAAPHPTIETPPQGSIGNDPNPSFSGSTDDPQDEVTLQIYAGSTVDAEARVQELTMLQPIGGSWSGGPVETLADGIYTAQASQTNSELETGTSEAVTFRIDTSPPTVTLNQPPPLSNDATPSFSGSASDTKPVTIQIHAGTDPEGEIVSTATAPEGGEWVSGPASPELASGQYTAVAVQPSSLGNGPGKSPPVTFTVERAPPTVTLDPPLTHSNNATPSFTGTASDTTLVTVKVFLGFKASGTPLAIATAVPSGGKWVSTQANLLSGRHWYTAIATEPSSLGNASGSSEPSAPFAVDTEAPSVWLNQPPPSLNDATPSFSGTASETTAVTVEVFAGSTAEGEPVATATAAGTRGAWSSGPTSPALPDGPYTAVAAQKSQFGHEPGGAGPVHFTVDTVPPVVGLSYPSGGSAASTSQLVQGSAGAAAGDLAGVTVQLFAGSGIASGQSPIQSIQVSAVNGTWSATFAGLSPGAYTARAEQADQAGNVGASNAQTFSLTGSLPGAMPSHPSASFSWSPTSPHAGEKVLLLSGSTDLASPITGFAWDVAGSGAFAAGGPVNSTSFPTPGKHLVQLRVTDANGAAGLAAQTIAVGAPAMPLMQPFPTVRITGTRSGSGIKLKLLTVRAAAGARIAIRCTGHGCPVKSQSRVAASGKPGGALVDFRRFQRLLPAGVILEVRVYKSGVVGKYTRFAIRRHKLPARTDSCAGPAGNPIACPAS